MNKKLVFGVLIAVLAALVLFVSIAQRVSATVVVEHEFNAPVEKIWLMWNDPETIKKWWSPKHFTSPIAQNDLRVGGKYLLSMQDPNGKISYNVGTYTEVEQNKKIVSLMSFADEQGNVVPAGHYGVPGKWPEAVQVSVEFAAEGDVTRVKVTETGIPMLMYVFAKMGWNQQFDKFDALLK